MKCTSFPPTAQVPYIFPDLSSNLQLCSSLPQFLELETPRIARPRAPPHPSPTPSWLSPALTTAQMSAINLAQRLAPCPDPSEGFLAPFSLPCLMSLSGVGAPRGINVPAILIDKSIGFSFLCPNHHGQDTRNIITYTPTSFS
jgi:hypothetical protein